MAREPTRRAGTAEPRRLAAAAQRDRRSSSRQRRASSSRARSSAPAEASTRPSASLASSHSRAASLTGSPITVYSKRDSAPTLPATARPGGDRRSRPRARRGSASIRSRERARGGERAAGRVVERQRRAEHGQRRVALELVDPAAVVLDDLDDDAEELVEQRDDLLRRALGGHRGRADEVDEQHGDLELLAAELDPALLRGAGDVLADVAAEQVAQLLALAQPVVHPVEAGLQQPEVAAVEDRHARVEVARLDAARARRAPSAPGRRPRAPPAR